MYRGERVKEKRMMKWKISMSRKSWRGRGKKL